jgi:hypothetical protein
MAASTRSVVLDSTAMSQNATEDGMNLLAAGVPLSLLLDLAGLTRAGSREIMIAERDDTSWVPRRLSA